jgi:hypothetical protein
VTVREKFLAIVVGLLLGVVALRALHGRINAVADERDLQLVAAGEELDQALDLLEAGNRADAKIRSWRAKSLPSESGVAESLYHHWLIEQLYGAGLDDVDLRPQPAIASRADFKSLSMIVQAGGSLDHLTQFLFAFYEADFLHKISRLTLVPNSSGNSVGLTMKIDALVLSDADQTDQLPSGTAGRLARNDVAAYQESIVARNVFTAYKPPPPPPPPKPAVVDKPKPKPKPRFDDATQAFLTAIVTNRAGGDALEVWINVRTTGETLRLGAGDAFHVGQMEGRITAIEPQAVVLETDEGRYRVAIGTHLRDGQRIAEAGGS